MSATTETTTPPGGSTPCADAPAIDPMRRCTATTRSGARCRSYAIVGAAVCRMHGGAAPQVKRAAARRVALSAAADELAAERARLGGGTLEVEPAVAMLEMVHEAAWNVAVLRGMVAELETGVEGGGGAGDGGLPDGDGDLPPPRPVLRGAIAGNLGSTSKTNEAAPHVLVTMYDAERERLVKWSKACRDAGVDEWKVRVEAETAALLVASFQRFEAAMLAVVEGAVAGAGGPPDVLAAVRSAWSTALPSVVRAAIDVGEVGEA